MDILLQLNDGDLMLPVGREGPRAFIGTNYSH